MENERSEKQGIRTNLVSSRFSVSIVLFGYRPRLCLICVTEAGCCHSNTTERTTKKNKREFEHAKQ